MATSKREHITPVLAELHWLPVAARIDFKIATITFNLLTTERRPNYLRELLQLRLTVATAYVRQSQIPRQRTAFVQWSSAHAAPRVWNALPHTITDDVNISAPVLKSRPKTFPYKSFYH